MTQEEVKRLLAFIESNFGILPSKKWQQKAIQTVRSHISVCWLTLPEGGRFLVERNTRNILVFTTEEQYSKRIQDVARYLDKLAKESSTKAYKQKNYKSKPIDISGTKEFSPIKWRT